MSGRWLASDLARRGITVLHADCLIAAAAGGCVALVGAGLAAANVADFPMAELTVERWAVGA